MGKCLQYGIRGSIYNEAEKRITVSELFLKLANSTSPSWFASRTQAADGLAFIPTLPTTQFPNTLLTGGINHERTFPFRHDSQPCQDAHDGRHFARCLPASAFAPQPSAAGDSRNLHGSCVESPCGLGGADAETRCAGVCQGVFDAEAARRCHYDGSHRRAVLCPVSCRGGCGESAGKLRLLSAFWFKLAKRWKLINEKLEFCGRTSGNALK